MIDVSNLTIGYKDTTVVKNLDFKLNKGEFIALIGANGAGKSTLINTLIGINLSLIHISEPTRRTERSRMPSSA